jgi:PKD repeat protein
MAAVGDSISQAVSSGGSLGASYPANAWSTGTNTTVNSHYARLLALNPAIAGRVNNDSVSGAHMVDLDGQMRVVVGQQPDYLTVLVGGNDLCTDTVGQMTSVADFTTQFTTAMNTLAAGSPNTKVLVVSIPRVNQLWELFHSSLSARFVWSVGGVCQSLLANPTSTQSADVQRRAQVAQRNIDYNAALAQVCAQYSSRCRYDGDAVYNVVFAKSDVSGDYFHPSITGQAKLAAVSWAAGYWPNGGPATDVPPTAAFTTSCVNLVCTLDASGSTDDRGIASYGWTFGDGGTGSGVTASHAFAAAGTYTVALVVTDTAGQTGTAAKAVTVTAPTAAVHLASAIGTSASRKSGWTASVAVSVRDGAGSAVGGATVTGTWSTGGTGTCVTLATGSCSFSANVSRKTQSVTWRVSSIAAAGYGYDASANNGSPAIILAP